MRISNSDWNILIENYTARSDEDLLDRRYELWLCGYIPQGLQLSSLVRDRPSRVLDFGCGNGRVSRYLANWHQYDVVGVDNSRTSIDKARSYSDGIEYVFIESDSIPESLGRFDACVCDHVLSTCPNLDGIERTLRAIRGALRPGSPISIYLDNTNFTAIRYFSFIAGEPGVTYQSGDILPMEISLDGEVVVRFDDFFWTPDDYLSVLDRAGFRDIGVDYPTPTDSTRAIYECYFDQPVAADLTVEMRYPPAALYTGFA